MFIICWKEKEVCYDMVSAEKVELNFTEVKVK